MNLITGGLAEVLSTILGVSLPAVCAALVFKAARVMLRHELGIWASRSGIAADKGTSLTGAALFDYRFIIDNVEPVPLDLPLTVTLLEEGFPFTDPVPLFPLSSTAAPGTSPVQVTAEDSSSGSSTKAESQTSPVTGLRKSPRFPESVRVYSGACVPTFVDSQVPPTGRGASRRSSIRFDEMHARDTWTVRLLTTAASVTLQVLPDGVPLSRINPLRPWLAITTSVSNITVSRDGVVSRGGKYQPSWPFAAWAAAASVSLYAVFRWLVLPYLVDDRDLLARSSDWDVCATLSLLLAVVVWFLWIRRPIQPAIQGYRGFRRPGSERLEFEE